MWEPDRYKSPSVTFFFFSSYNSSRGPYRCLTLSLALCSPKTKQHCSLFHDLAYLISIAISSNILCSTLRLFLFFPPTRPVDTVDQLKLTRPCMSTAKNSAGRHRQWKHASQTTHLIRPHCLVDAVDPRVDAVDRRVDAVAPPFLPGSRLWICRH